MNDEDTYRANPALNFSTGRFLLDCPAAYQDALTGDKKEPTLAMEMGSAVHEWLLLGKPPQYVVKPEQNEAGDTWHGNKKWCKEWVKSQPEGLLVLTKDEAAMQMKIVNALSASPLVQSMLDSAQAKEEPLYFEYRGVPMKSRLDLWGVNGEGRPFIADLKKTISCAPREWEKTCANRFYRLQSAVYRTALAMTKGLTENPLFYWVAVDGRGIVQVYQETEKSQAKGQQQLDQMIDLYLECKASGNWYGYQKEGQPLFCVTLPWEDKE